MNNYEPELESQTDKKPENKIKNDEPAFPSPKWPNIEVNTGLTKREEFAKSAMIGLLGNTEITTCPFTQIAEFAVQCADSLIKELSRGKNADTN